MTRTLSLALTASAFALALAAPVAAQDACLATAEDLHLSDAQLADVADRDLTFGFLTNNISDDFSRTLVAGGEAYAEEIGVELIVNNADFDANTQLSQFDALLQRQVDGIFLTAVDASSIGQAVNRANRDDIPVFIVGGAPARGEVISVMNASSYQGSFDAGSAMMEAIGEANAQVAILGIPFALQTIRDREKGILDAVGAAGGQVISMQSDFSQDRLLELATNVIQANPDLKGIFATWSLAVNAATEAVEQSGRDIVIAGYDSEVPGYVELASGDTNIVALSGQQAALQGRAAVEGLVQSIMGAELCDEIITPNLLVTADNFEESWSIQYPGAEQPW
ncbi:MAG: sugar ABC transporter substrate-binding protein [Rhizobiales bacterium]|nr:sugar ABC transporter substrate-binding protein [Hyphomicrobiales bacterium]MBO6698323.1 sugar ABC transporter substrate-binding protein [Hyphomicrobiales bacterium]MBO6735423.1 sugar ABC transporter substrate-binding protein [Hyphomicrobiales bacterium]MBO6910769.1 sugar ABC transporter substrate-binding protein [Hyphomicrobiales bacterium]MBO6956512.1 sugar ABC transporter substrate-binding protein [Hyphomicrobiales bacterium]